MPLELELKFDLPPSTISQVKAHPVLAALPAHTAWLENRYFDTPDGALRTKKWALRIRSKRGQFYQTLKGQGTVDGARHARLEWEVPLAVAEAAAPQLLWSAWLGVVPADILAQLEPLWPQLREVFSTNFSRTQWLYAVPAEQGGGAIEVALDEGAAQVCDATGKVLASSPICELELEQQGCSEAALDALAQQLRHSLPLTPSSISKAQRGLALLRELGLAG